MEKIAMKLLLATLLCAAAFSCSKKEPEETAPPSPTPNLQSRMEKQQKAIQRASEEVQKAQSQNAAAEKTATPSPTPP